MCTFSKRFSPRGSSKKETLSCPREGMDGAGLCIIHSQDRDKSLSDFSKEVARSITSAITEAASGHASGKEPVEVDLRGAQVPPGLAWRDLTQGTAMVTECIVLDLSLSRFFAEADFCSSQWHSVICQQATIAGAADFSDSSLGGDAYFHGASIGGDAFFLNASLGGSADFSDSSLGGDAYFWNASLGGDANFSDSSLGGDAYFWNASLGGDANFSDSSLGGDADFSDSSLGGDAYFHGASIGGDADFRGSSLGGDADFRGSSLGGDADFRDSSLGGSADFRDSSLGGSAYFRDSSLGGDADFRDSSLGGDAYFGHSSLGGDAYFGHSSLGGSAYFRDSSLGGSAYFRRASIGGDAIFWNASIGGDAYFWNASIGGYADFRDSSLGGSADFRDSSLGGDAYFRDSSLGGAAGFSGMICLGNCDLSGLSARSVYLDAAMICQLRGDRPMVDVGIANSVVLGLDVSTANEHSLKFTGCQPRGWLQDNKSTAETSESWKRLTFQKEIYNASQDYLLKAEESTVTRADLLKAVKRTAEGLVTQAGEEGKKSRELADSIKKIDPSGDLRQEGTVNLMRLCPAINALLLGGSKPIESKNIKKAKEKIRSTIEQLEKFTSKEGEFFWDFRSRDMTRMSFIECDLSRADFSSSNITSTHFDSCSWGKSKKKKHAALYRHDELVEKKDKDNVKLSKLRNVYQRLKKSFEENHDYRQAGDFHYREMQVRQCMSKEEKSRLDHLMLWLYCLVADYGESYPKIGFSILAWSVLFPFVAALVTACYIKSSAIMSMYTHFLTYYFFAVVPRSISNAAGVNLEEKNVKIEGVGYLDLSAWEQSFLGLSVVVFYIGFVALLALFVMSLRRRYRR